MKTIILISSVLLLSGCSLFKTQTEYLDRPVPSEFTLAPPTQVAPISTKEIKFNVISQRDFMEAAMDKYNLSLEDATELAKVVYEDNIALVTLDLTTYGHLGENMQEILRYIKDQQASLQYYKDNVPEPSAVKTDAEKEG